MVHFLVQQGWVGSPVMLSWRQLHWAGRHKQMSVTQASNLIYYRPRYDSTHKTGHVTATLTPNCGSSWSFILPSISISDKGGSLGRDRVAETGREVVEVGRRADMKCACGILLMAQCSASEKDKGKCSQAPILTTVLSMI